ncbi:hypothetical protein FQA39_LY07801 [Lamprigera yunnana]|nr:hypothetical protein FQA39_LY07801 [Lamprigera yunnana]
MNALSREAQNLSNILNVRDFGFIRNAFTTYDKIEPLERTCLVLQDYFNSVELSPDVLETDANLIGALLPMVDKDHIKSLLKIIGSEENRVRITVKLLINERNKEVHKRTFESQDDDAKVLKRVENDGDDAQFNSQESETTIIYYPNEDDELLKSETINDDNNYPIVSYTQWDQPSTSGNQFKTETATKPPSVPTEKRDVKTWLDSCEITPSSVQVNGGYDHNILPNAVETEGSNEGKNGEVHNIPQVQILPVTSNGNKRKKRLKIDNELLKYMEPITVIDDFNDEIYFPETYLNSYTEDIDSIINVKDDKNDKALVSTLTEMFPEACPTFIRSMCHGKSFTNEILDELISQILAVDYPKRAKSKSPPPPVNIAEQFQIMKNILVDADPDYLQMHFDRLIDKPEELKIFIEEAVEKRNYPSLQDALRRLQLSAQQKQYTGEFRIEKFLEVIPNPFEYFKNHSSAIKPNDYQSLHYALSYLRNKFCHLSLRLIREYLKEHNIKFLDTCEKLSSVSRSLYMKSKRAICPMPETITNIPLLQEIVFYEHQDEIEQYLKEKRLKDEEERAHAKACGIMQTCLCCYDDEVMPRDIYTCQEGCIFCKDCIKKGVEVAFGDGKLNFLCLGNCTSYFSLQVLQAVLEPKMFSIIALKKQVEEVKAAGIEDLETCPFCDFATIPNRDDKLFRCLNPVCMKESCRQCKEPSHIPLRCEEVEKDNDVKARTFIENKMTEALLRTCYKCGMKFIKTNDGCNKMTCSCGAFMCYVCGKPVQDYKHFKSTDGRGKNLCPLYSNTVELHRDAVLEGAKKAKTEIGVRDSELKINPSSDIQHHYNTNQKPQDNQLDDQFPRIFQVMDLFIGENPNVHPQRHHHRRHHHHQRANHRQRFM